MRDLNNLDELVEVLVEVDEPLRTIAADKEIRRIWREGSYWDMLMHMLKTHRTNLYAVVAALDGGITAAEVPARYKVTEIFSMFRTIAANEEYREIFAFFGFAERRKGAASSGSAMVNTVE